MSHADLMARFVAGSLARVRRLATALRSYQAAAPAPADVHEWLGDLHTLKGEAKMLGLAALSSRAHALEERLLPLRDGVSLSDDAVRACVGELRGIEQDLRQNGTKEQEKGGAGGRWMHVPAERLDAVCDELLSLNDSLLQLQASATRDRVVNEALGRIRLQLASATAKAWSLRMVGVEPTLEQLADHASALATETQKRLRCTANASGVQMERGILEALWDPLLHLVRNAVDHGIEPPSRRVGKPEEGLLVLSAEAHGTDVELCIEDDGAGIDADAVRQAAAARGVSADSNEQVYELLFQPGFSTRTSVSETSGRGMGLDVVRRKVEALGGSIHIESTAGEGTRFVVRVSASLAQERLLVVAVGQTLYGLPARQIIRVVDLTETPIASSVLGPSLRFLDHDVPLRSLAVSLGHASEDAESRALVVNIDGRRWAFAVPRVVGEFELLRRPLDSLVQSFGKLAASAMFDDGRLVLIVRLAELVRVQQRVSPVVTTSPATKPTILVVDDSPIVCDLMRGVLQGEGYQVVTAHNGEEALSVLPQCRPALVISDVEMPRMDGFELLREIRRQSDRLPVIMVTTRGEPEARSRASTLGANAYLIKTDFEGATLLATVGRFLAPAE